MTMIDKISKRARRALKTRMKIRRLGMPRLSVHRSSRHVSVQLISATGAETLASASTQEVDLRKAGPGSNVDAATRIGTLIAERAKAKGITKVAFDRSGFKFHGRVKALADAAREGGLEF